MCDVTQRLKVKQNKKEEKKAKEEEEEEVDEEPDSLIIIMTLLECRQYIVGDFQIFTVSRYSAELLPYNLSLLKGFIGEFSSLYSDHVELPSRSLSATCCISRDLVSFPWEGD